MSDSIWGRRLGGCTGIVWHLRRGAYIVNIVVGGRDVDVFRLSQHEWMVLSLAARARQIPVTKEWPIAKHIPLLVISGMVLLLALSVIFF